MAALWVEIHFVREDHRVSGMKITQLDQDGEPVVPGRWYWAQNRQGKVVGAGKFNESATLFILNNDWYGVSSFFYAKVAESPESIFGAIS